MNAQDISRWQDLAVQYGSDFGIKVLAAIAFWVIGRWLIHRVGSLVQSALERQKVDATIMRYLGTVINVTLNIVLVIGILGYFGIQTTSFAALFAAAGVAIGLAWSGLLSNFAGGVFLIILRPIKVGDFVTVGGITGTVKEVGLFVSAINTPDNVLTLVGNSKIFSDTIQNFSTNAYRRVDLKAQLAGAADHAAAMSTAQGEDRDPSPTCCRIRRSMSRFSNSISSVRCSRCVPTATPITTGRSISTPTGSIREIALVGRIPGADAGAGGVRQSAAVARSGPRVSSGNS
jgi:small conductance mechanosensitive channel